MPITVQNVKEMQFYQGDQAIPGIRFRAARQAMGISAWGMNVLDLEPHTTGYPEHDHRHDGQEEVYLVLQGSVTLVAEGRERVLSVGDMVRVPPEVTRKFVTTEQPASLLALGATPGKPYAPDERMATT
jgi:mannose-6-phosphate isomerase-like protein (cupin superfamily)